MRIRERTEATLSARRSMIQGAVTIADMNGAAKCAMVLTLSVLLLSVGSGSAAGSSAAAAAPAPSRLHPWTLLVGRGTLRPSLGPLKRMNRTNVDKTVELLGEPTSRKNADGGCFLSWGHLGLRAEWWYYGSEEGGGCGPFAAIQSLTIGGRAMYGRIRTSAGLRVGQRVQQIRRCYRNAKLESGSSSRWLLTPYYTMVGINRWTSPITAVVKNGRVDMFEVYVGGAGE